MTVRELIKDVLKNIKPDIQGVEATSKMVELSVLLGNLGEHIVNKEKAYIEKKISIMNENDKLSMNKIELLAQNTDEYHELNTARQFEKACVEMIRTLKYRCRALIDEQEASKNT